ncbi:MAG: DNA topoisomerase [Desulfobacterium sp.]|nr:DNA topoisomerase [Desulfobacterium sp.]
MVDLILTEKFSVAADFAKALGIKGKKEGCFQGPTHVIVWAVGHLVELFEPDDYDPGLKRWQLSTLPLIPETFKYKPIGRSFKQFKIIKSLLKRGEFDRVVIATDAGREGEVIARTILLESGFKDKSRIVRFWTSQALVPEVVRSTMEQLRPIEDYDRLWRAGYYRQVADWLVGMNLTRVLTVRLKDLFSVGRVQTAVLALVVDRRSERENFVPETFWQIKVVFINEKGRWTGLWFKERKGGPGDKRDSGIETRIVEKEQAIALVSDLKNETAPGVVVTVKREKKSEPPPLLFSLTDLQQEANNRFGFSAKKTLSLAQTLYQDRKCLSYPRTDSKVLGTAGLDLVKKIIKTFGTAHGDIFSTVDPRRVSLSTTRVFNDGRLTDHHALIPFKPIPAGASGDEHLLFDLVVRRFAAAFHPDFSYESTRVVTDLADQTFQTLGRVTIDPGWTRVYSPGSRGQAEPEILPPLAKDDRGKADKVDILEKKTVPPPDYSDALLLKDMTNPSRYVEEDDIRRIFRGDTGIGTQSTRAQIIETLILRGYVTRAGKRLIATDKGVYLIIQLRRCPVSSVLTRPDETARWEMGLNAIALGQEANLDFLNRIKTFVAAAVAELKLADLGKETFERASESSSEIGTCPSCGGPVSEGRKAFACRAPGCSFVIFKQIAGKRISSKMAANLLKYRRSGPFQGFISKKKRRFPACLRIVDHGGAHKVEFDFNTGKEKQGQDPGGPARSSVSSWAPDSVPGVMKMSTLPDDHPPALCPVCRGGIIEGNRGFGCSNWRVNDGDCRFVIWKTILGKTLTPDNIATLAAGKKTRPYVFKHDNDVKFTATLKMIEKDRAFFIQVEPTQGQGDIINVSCQR